MTLANSVGIRAFALATFALAGCGGGETLRTDAPAAGIRAAEEVGAAEVPRAALHLQLAKEELERARKLAKDGEKAKAASMLQRAEADAELAVALSREEAERTESQEAMKKVQELRDNNALLLN